MRIFGDQRSGNCLKVKWAADYLGLVYDWTDVDIIAGESHEPEFLRMNPAGQVPCVRFDDGRTLAQSNAIMLHLAEGSTLLPDDPFERAQMMELLFWEQYSHEPNIAVCRFQKLYLGRSDEELDPEKVKKGYDAIAILEARLNNGDYLVGDRLSLADIALVAYTRVAHEGSFDLANFPLVRTWISRVERGLGLQPL